MKSRLMFLAFATILPNWGICDTCSSYFLTTQQVNQVTFDNPTSEAIPDQPTPNIKFSTNPAEHPQEPKRQKRRSKKESKKAFAARYGEWANGVVEWIEAMTDPTGILRTSFQSLTALGISMRAKGAIFNATGYARSFEDTRSIVLFTKLPKGKMYDYPTKGDVAEWDGSTIVIHYANGTSVRQSDLRRIIMAKSDQLIRQVVRDASKGRDIEFQWNWSQHEILYFVFTSAWESMRDLNISDVLRPPNRIWIDQVNNQLGVSYKITVASGNLHSTSSVRTFYLNNQAKIVRVESNGDLLDGGEEAKYGALIPIIQRPTQYQPSPLGILIPTVQISSIDQGKFERNIRKIAKDKARKKAEIAVDDFFGWVPLPLAPLAAIGGFVADGFAQPIARDAAKKAVHDILDAASGSFDPSSFAISSTGIIPYFSEGDIP